jgi:hypothetical protein
MNWRRWLIWSLVGLLGVLLIIQFVPYGRAHDNPPVIAEPAWDTTATRDLVQRACYDCHSYETVWPWYTYVAPISWLTQRDVDEGRGRLNFSNWGPGAGDSGEITGVVREGEMPPVYYTWMHPSARLSDAERNQLIQGIEITVAGG